MGIIFNSVLYSFSDCFNANFLFLSITGIAFTNYLLIQLSPTLTTNFVAQIVWHINIVNLSFFGLNSYFNVLFIVTTDITSQRWWLFGFVLITSHQYSMLYLWYSSNWSCDDYITIVDQLMLFEVYSGKFWYNLYHITKVSFEIYL
jgi:hypothetical protein